jgi:hypothetical protein
VAAITLKNFTLVGVLLLLEADRAHQSARSARRARSARSARLMMTSAQRLEVEADLDN